MPWLVSRKHNKPSRLARDTKLSFRSELIDTWEKHSVLCRWRLEHSQVRKFKIWTCTSFIGFEELRLFQCLKRTHFTIHACCNVQDSNHEHHHITWFSLVFTFLDTVGGWFRVRNWLSFVCNTSKRNISISIPTSFELTPRSLFHFSLNVWRGYHWRTLS